MLFGSDSFPIPLALWRFLIADAACSQEGPQIEERQLTSIQARRPCSEPVCREKRTMAQSLFQASGFGSASDVICSSSCSTEMLR